MATSAHITVDISKIAADVNIILGYPLPQGERGPFATFRWNDTSGPGYFLSPTPYFA
jgi:hypothetical protein